MFPQKPQVSTGITSCQERALVAQLEQGLRRLKPGGRETGWRAGATG